MTTQEQPPVADNKKASGFYRARVEVLWGDRRMSDFMVNADLGLTGMGVTGILVISYKPGLVVDDARVCRAMDQTIKDSEAERTELKLHSYKLLGIEWVGGPEA